MVTKHEKIFVQKLRQLLSSPTFDDISFNCKDGKVSGNRLILSLYSSFLRKIFEDNPNIVSHPLNDDPTTGINVTEIEVKDLSNLLRILNTQAPADVNDDSVEGIVGAARLMEIELKVDKLRNGLVRIRAIPDLNENSLKKKITVIDKSVGVECKVDGKEEKREQTKENKVKRNAHNSSTKQHSKARSKTKSLPSASTVCPYCNITCKSVRGLQVHVGYIHKNEVKNLKNEASDLVTASSKPVSSSQNSCGAEKNDVLTSVATVASDDISKQCSEHSEHNASFSNDHKDNEKQLLEPAYGSGDHTDAQTITSMMDNIDTNVEQFNQFQSYSIGNLVPNASASLMNGLPHDGFSENPVTVADLPASFPLISRQQGHGTLICLPKTQLYEQIENGYACGICEMKFPDLANLNVHMTYCHGLTILVKEN